MSGRVHRTKAGGSPFPRIAGRYDLVDDIKSGAGDTRIWRGASVDGDDVMIKLLPLPKDPEMRQRRRGYFEDEVECGEALQDPHIRAYLDSGHVEDGTRYGYPNGFLFLVFEWIDFGSLRDLLKRGPLPPLRIPGLVHAVAQGLEAAHDAGYCHRDLKPENILLPGGRCDDAKIADFGIARHVEGTRLTTSLFAGTPSYMAPEQFEASSDVTPAADLYSLGLILWELLDGTIPYDKGDSGLTMSARLKAGPLPDIRRGATSLTHLAAALRRVLARDPRKRPSSASEVAGLVCQAGEVDGLWVSPLDEAGRARNGLELLSHRPRDIGSFIVQQGVEVEDNRASGGAFWVLGGSDAEELIELLRSWGYSFTFANRRRGRAGWYLKQ